MTILLAIDDSKHSKIVLEKGASRLYLPNTKVHIVTAYKATPTMNDTNLRTILKIQKKENTESPQH